MYRLFGAVVAPNTSIDNMGLTNLRLLQESIRYLTEQGVDLIYVLPDPKWKGFMSRYLDIQIERFPLYSRLLTIDEKLDKPSDIQIEKIDPADERINPLWQQLSDHYPVSPVKDGPYFNWKSVSLGYQLFLVKESHQPIGLFALSNRGNTPDISIAEWLTDNGREHQRLILQAAISESIKQKQTRDHLRKVGILANQNMIPLLEELGFWPDDYTYLLGLQPLQDQYRKELTNMANWQLSAGD
jgi:hypothetical protein